MGSFRSLGDIIKDPDEFARRLAGQPRAGDTGERLPYGCKKCDGYGNLITEEGARQCECVLRYKAELRLKQAGLPELFRDKDLENFKCKDMRLKAARTTVRNYLKAYSAENNRGLLLFGPAGSGKTHLAVGALKELIKAGYEALFVNVNDLFEKLRASVGGDGNGNTAKTLMAGLVEVDVLLLDDLGAQKTTSYVLDRLYAVINGRYQKRRTMLVTTNLAQVTLEMNYGQPIASRLSEMCQIYPMPEVADYRQMISGHGDK